MMKAIGIVAKTVKVAQALSNIALTTAIERPAKVRRRIKRKAKEATRPADLPISFSAIFERLCPLCRTDAKSTIISWTPPAITAPMMIQSAPGR